MKVDIVRPKDLSPSLLDAWRAIQASETALHSPLFSAEYTRLVGSVREDCEIAVLEDAGHVVGFFPFHRTRGDIGRPVGLRLTDLHGAIIRCEYPWDAAEVVSRCQLRAWHFDHLIASQRGFVAFHWTAALSPYMDLTDGFDEYCAERRNAGTELISQVQRKARKIQRELGPLRFTPHSTSSEDFAHLIEWKSDQHRRTGVMEIFRLPWVRELAERVRTAHGQQFEGMLSTLHAGDQLVAIHLGMRSDKVWHLWFPTFDRQYSSYSPGLILLLEMARTAPRLGIRRIDLGKGPERYKASFLSGADHLAEGSVDARPILGRVHRGWHEMKHWIRGSRLRGPFSAPLQWTRRFRQRLAFR